MLATTIKGTGKDQEKCMYQFDHSVETPQQNGSGIRVELSGVVIDGRKQIKTIEIPQDADQIFIMNDAGKTVQKIPATTKTSEMRHARETGA